MMILIKCNDVTILINNPIDTDIYNYTNVVIVTNIIITEFKMAQNLRVIRKTRHKSCILICLLII